MVNRINESPFRSRSSTFLALWLLILVRLPGAAAAQPVLPEVNLQNANVYLSYRDVVLVGGEWDLTWRRTFNSRGMRDGTLAPGWSHTFGQKLDLADPASPRFHHEDGKLTTFTRADARTFRASEGETTAKLLLDAGEYALHRTGQILRFEGHGQLVAVEEGGRKTTIQYKEGKISSVTDWGGRILKVSTDDAGRMTSITDPAGETIVYSYTGRGDLESVTDQIGGRTAYEYDAAGLLAGIALPDGAAIRIAYVEGKDWVQRLEGPGARSRSYRYQTDPSRPEDFTVEETRGTGAKFLYQFKPGGTRITTDPLGRRAVHEVCATCGGYDLREDALGHRWGHDHSGNQQLVSVDPLGGRTVRTFHGTGKPLQETNALGEAILTRTYDAAGNLLSVSRGNAPATKFVRQASGYLKDIVDPMGRRYKVKTDAAGSPVEIVDPLGGVTKITVDPVGRVTRVDLPGGFSQECAWNGRSQLIHYRDELGGVRQLTYDLTGRLAGLVDPLGQETKFDYTPSGKVKTRTLPTGTVVACDYDAEDQLIECRVGSFRVGKYEFDPAGQLVAVHELNEAITRYEYNATGLLGTVTDPLGGKATYQYDPAGRLILKQDPAGGRTAYVWDLAGRIIGLVDPAGRKLQVAYAGGDVVTSVTHADGRSDSFDHDAMGRILSTRLASGIRIQQAYDALGRLTETVHSLRGKTRIEYGKDGRPSAVNRPDGTRVAIEYLKDNASFDIVYPDGRKSTHRYDILGRPVEIEAGAEKHARTYTRQGMLESEQYGTEVTRYSYDELDRLLRIVEPDGDAVQYTYAGEMRPSGIAFPNGVEVAYAYDAGHRKVSRTIDAQMVTSWKYDAVGAVIGLSHTSGKDVLARYDLLLDPTSHIRQVKGPDSGSATTVQLDASARITRSSGVAGELTFGFDRSGLLASLQRGGETHAVQRDSAGRLVALGGVRCDYGLTSLLTRKSDRGKVTAYAYDREGRLASVTPPDGTPIEYRYGGDGLLRGRKVAGSDAAESYAYERLHRVEDRDAHGKVVARYGYGADLDEMLWYERDGQIHFPLADHLGTIQQVANPSGKIALEQRFDLWGQLVSRKGDLPFPVGFTGRFFDPSSGIYDHRLRSYDPSLGIFLQPDSLVPTEGFTYAGYNPLSLVDPLGAWSCRGLLTAVGGAVLAVGVTVAGAAAITVAGAGAAAGTVAAGLTAGVIVAGIAAGAAVGGAIAAVTSQIHRPPGHTVPAPLRNEATQIGVMAGIVGAIGVIGGVAIAAAAAPVAGVILAGTAAGGAAWAAWNAGYTAGQPGADSSDVLVSGASGFLAGGTAGAVGAVAGWASGAWLAASGFTGQVAAALGAVAGTTIGNVVGTPIGNTIGSLGTEDPGKQGNCN